LGVKKAKIDPQSPKTEFGAQNQYGRVIYPSIGNFTWNKKKYIFMFLDTTQRCLLVITSLCSNLIAAKLIDNEGIIYAKAIGLLPNQLLLSFHL
jgi:hypothetical protein